MLTSEEKKEILEQLKEELYSAKKIYVETCREDVQLPTYSNVGDAGMDIRAAEDVVLLPGETKIIPTGLKMAIPDGYELQVRPRSGLSLKTPLRIANSPGTIDSGYRDEIGVIVTNCSPVLVHNIQQDRYNGEVTYSTPIYYEEMFRSINENEPGAYLISKGDRIAQIVLCKYETIEFERTELGVVKTIGKNRGGGFRHSGTK